MLIVSRDKKKPVKKILEKRKIFFSGLIIILVLVSAFGTGYLYHRSGNSLKLAYGLITSPLITAKNYVSGVLNSKPERIMIDIKYKNFLRLSNKRLEAIKMGSLRESDEDWVPAKIRYNGDIYNIKMRLKGDLEDHWKHDTWSFKIEVKDGKTLFGMKRFAIQHPRTREYLNEWVLHKLFKYAGLIGLRYDFIEVTINGKEQPIYAIEENFDKLLIENNNLREGPIFRFDTSYLVHNVQQDVLLHFYGSEISPYGLNKIQKDKLPADQFSTAANLIELFRQNKLIASQVFDSKKLALFFALIDLTGHKHATLLDNIKFYYNPITSLIEPIIYDNVEMLLLNDLSTFTIEGANKQLDLDDGTKFKNDDWFEPLFKDAKFFKDYVKALEKVSDKKFLDDFFDSINSEYNEKLDVLHRSYPWYNFEGKEILRNNQEFIKRILEPVKSLNVYYNKFSSAENLFTLDLINIHALPAEILGLTIADSILLSPLEKDKIVQASSKTEPIKYVTLHFKLPQNIVWSNDQLYKIKLTYKIFGRENIRSEKINQWRLPSSDFAENDLLRQKPNYEKFKFLETREAEKEIIIKNGTWTIDESLIIPEGYKIICESGTKLNLKNSAVVVSYSPFQFVGEKGNPIEIYSTDSKGQGIVVMNAYTESLFKYVVFKNLSNPVHNGWELTGAITFYNSPVVFSDCRFVESRCEDALNIVRSDFNIDNCIFSNTQADAIDSDFSKGRITNSSFYETGNDALDVSGTTIRLENIYIFKPGDKGVSAGEKSFVNCENIKVEGGELAFASKDLSKIKIDGAEINSSKVGFTVYQKKPEYGPASIEGEHIEMSKVEVPYLIEKKSTLIVEGKIILPNEDKVKDMLYGSKYGKSSK